MTDDRPAADHDDHAEHVDPLRCDAATELISASMDGETTRAERRRLDDHLARCDDCDALATRLLELDRGMRMHAAVEVPDLVGAVTARVRPAQLGRGGWIRPALAWVAVVLAVQSIPPLVFGEVDGAETHLARHLGAFGLALAIGFAYAVWRPHRAFGMVPFAAALVVTMLASTGFDVLDGDRSAWSEVAHAAEIVGLVLLWMLAGSPGWHGWHRPHLRHHHPA